MRKNSIQFILLIVFILFSIHVKASTDADLAKCNQTANQAIKEYRKNIKTWEKRFEDELINAEIANIAHEYFTIMRNNIDLFGQLLNLKKKRENCLP